MDIINELLKNKELSNAVVITGLFLVSTFNIISLILLSNIDKNLGKLVKEKK